MKAFLKSVVAGLLAVLLIQLPAQAQERPAFTPGELDQMLAPVALYPDSLLTQILMAATYPLEVVQAARWSRANPHLKGQEAVRAVESLDWDPSVKSLVAFPQILHRMDENLDWTQRLGEAFLEQEPHVMDAIQGLRQRAEAAGNLRSNEQIRVSREDGNILLEPAQPHVIYVPYYEPTVVYGRWWWPAYPPVFWAPPPGYYAWPGIYWGPAVAFSWGFFFGHFDWHHRHVKVVHVEHRPHARPVTRSNPVKWQHNPIHRRNVPYRYAKWQQPAGRHPALRGGERSRPVARPEPHSGHPKTRNAAPQPRPQFAAPQTRPERSAPQAGNRLPERTARADPGRPQPRTSDRSATVVPRMTPQPRAAVPPPAVRAEPRPIPQLHTLRVVPRTSAPAANARPVPQRSEPGRRAEARHPARPGAVTPRAAAGAPVHVPRVAGGHVRAEARGFGGSPPQARSHSSMAGGRRF